MTTEIVLQEGFTPETMIESESNILFEYKYDIAHDGEFDLTVALDEDIYCNRKLLAKLVPPMLLIHGDDPQFHLRFGSRESYERFMAQLNAKVDEFWPKAP